MVCTAEIRINRSVINEITRLYKANDNNTHHNFYNNEQTIIATGIINTMIKVISMLPIVSAE